MGMPMGYRQPLDVRLAKRLLRTDRGCLEYRGSPNKNGYGRLNIDGSMQMASHVVWERTNGPITNGLWVLHTCDNPACIELSHLFLGTPADNTADAKSKGRLAVGERAGAAKLTEQQAMTIKAMAKIETHAEVASRFGISRQHVGRIAAGGNWQHLA